MHARVSLSRTSALWLLDCTRGLATCASQWWRPARLVRVNATTRHELGYRHREKLRPEQESWRRVKGRQQYLSRRPVQDATAPTMLLVAAPRRCHKRHRDGGPAMTKIPNAFRLSGQGGRARLRRMTVHWSAPSLMVLQHDISIGYYI